MYLPFIRIAQVITNFSFVLKILLSNANKFVDILEKHFNI